MDYAFLPEDMRLIAEKAALPKDGARYNDRFSNGDQEAYKAATILGKDADKYAARLTQYDQDFAQSMKDSELTDLEKLYMINRSSADIFTYDMDEDKTGEKIAHTTAMRRGDCDDVARRNYALAVAAGIPADQLAIGIGAMRSETYDINGNLEVGQEGHATLFYQDTDKQTYIVDMNFRDPIKLQPPEASETHDFITGSLDGNVGYADATELINKDIMMAVQPGGLYKFAPDAFYSEGQTVAVRSQDEAIIAEKRKAFFTPPSITPSPGS